MGVEERTRKDLYRVSVEHLDLNFDIKYKKCGGYERDCMQIHEKDGGGGMRAYRGGVEIL